MYGGPRHTGPPNNPQSAPPPPQPQFLSGPSAVINESCERIKKEFEALQSINHRLSMDLEQVRNEKHEKEKSVNLYYEMSYGFHLEMCKEREVVKRLTGIIMNILPYLSNDQQHTLASSVDRAKLVSPEEVNNIIAEQMRESAWNASNGLMDAHLPPSLAGLQHRRPLSGSSGIPGMPHGLGPHPGPPIHIPHSLPPHNLPPHGPPMHGLPPSALLPPGINLSSPPNAGLLALSGGPGGPGLGAGLLGGPGILPPHALKAENLPGTNRSNSIPSDANSSNNNNNNNNNNNSINNAFNHNKPPRGSIDSERRAASSSSATSEREHRDMHSASHNQTNESKNQKKFKRSDESSSYNQHQVMLNNTSSISDDEKSEDLVVDGNDDRPGSTNSHLNGGSISPRENGGANEWNKSGKKERPNSRASSVTSGPSMKQERSSPSMKSGSSKTKLSPNQLPNIGPIPEGIGPIGPNSMLPGMTNYGRGMYMNPLGQETPARLPIGPNSFGMPQFGPPSETCSIQLDSDGRPKYIPCSPRALADPSVPKRAREVFSLHHGEVVCALALSNPTKNIYTGGKGFVKVWSLDNSESNNEMRQPRTLKNPVAEIECLQSEHYVRSCKLLPDGKKLIVGGEMPPISVWDLACGGSPKKIGILQELAQACYALAISPDSKICITCCSDGSLGIYDIHNLKLIGKFQGHSDGASCIDISSDGNTLWTGGLDMGMKSWDLSPARSQMNSDELTGPYVMKSQSQFPSQIFSLGCCPSGDYVAVGMENSIIEVMNTNKHDKMRLKMHESCVLALKFASSGKWFISTGKDKIVNLCGSPSINCPLIMKTQENSSVLSCDISNDDKYFATGSGDKKATVYEVLYN